MIARVLDYCSDPAAVDYRPGLRAFRSLLLLHAVVRTWAWAPHSFFATLSVPYAVALSLLACLTLTRHAQRATLAAVLLLAVEQYSIFPATPNHIFLEFACLALVALLDLEDDSDGRLLLAGLRWMGLVVFFSMGLQKLLLGNYLHGEFLAFAVAVRDPFADLFKWLLPAAEIGRLRAASQLGPGDGPFVSEAWAFVAAANLVWIAELTLPGWMMWRRTRSGATVAALLVLLGLHLSGRNTLFALLLAQMLLLLPSGTWNERLRLPLFGVYLYLLAQLAGWLPGFFLAKDGTL